MRDLTLKMEAALAAASLSDADKIGAEVLKHTMYADVLDVFRVTGHHIPYVYQCGIDNYCMYGIGLCI